MSPKKQWTCQIPHKRYLFAGLERYMSLLSNKWKEMQTN